MNRHIKNESGQIVIVSVMIIVALVMSIVVVVYLNQLQGRFGTANIKRQKAHSVTEAGLDYALQVLANPAIWKNALSAQFPAEFGSPGNLTKYDPAGTGNSYTIQCSTGGALASYQVQLLVTGYTQQNGVATATRALSAVVSKRTLAATLSNGIDAAVALQLKVASNIAWPTGSQGLTLQWGPAMCFDSATWILGGEDWWWYRIRKFSQGPQTQDTTKFGNPLPDTDGLSYWMNTAVGYSNDVDLASYQALAQAETGVPAPLSQVNGTPLTANPSGSGYFTVPNGDTALFKNGYSLTASSAVIYVNGNAEIDDIAIDLKSNGAMIVSGNLAVHDPLSAGNVLNLRVPPTASLEYPYWNGGDSPWPCMTQVGQTCSIASITGPSGNPPYSGNGKVQFRGFLYVTGTLTNLNVPPTCPSTCLTPPQYVMAGVLRVDGFAEFGWRNYQQFNLYYDDEINRNILVTPFQLMVDSQTEVTAR